MYTYTYIHIYDPQHPLNMSAPTRTLLHTYNHHDHHDNHYHHDHHHIMIIIALNFATPYEQYVVWGNSINFIFIRDQNLPTPMNNMLIGAITSTLSSYPPEVRPGATSGLQRTCLSINLADVRCTPVPWNATNSTSEPWTPSSSRNLVVTPRFLDSLTPPVC